MEITERKLTRPALTKFAYFFSKFAFTCLTCLELYYFSAFLTDAAHLRVAFVTGILTVTGIIDLIFSFVNGVILEKIRMPWGKYRSWLLVAPPIVGAFVLLMFSKIGSNDIISSIIIIVGFVMSHLIWSVGESAWNSLPLLLTDDQEERASLSTQAGRGQIASGLVFGFISVPVITWAANSTGSSVLGYASLAIILVLIYCTGYWWMFAISAGSEDDGNMENVKDAAQTTKKEKTLTLYKSAFKNSNLLVLIIGMMANFCYQFLFSGLMYYFFSYTLNSFALMGTYITLQSVMGLIGSLFTPVLMRWCKGSKKQTYCISYAFLAISLIIVYFLRNLGFWPFAIITSIGLILGSSGMMLLVAMFTDCAVYSEYQTGRDVKGFIMSLMNVPIKIGIILKNVILSGVLSAVGYVSTEIKPTYSDGFAVGFCLVPAVLCIFALLVVGIGYHLKEDEIVSMQKEIRRKNKIG